MLAWVIGVFLFCVNPPECATSGIRASQVRHQIMCRFQ